MACTLTTFTKAPMNITEGLRLGSGGESSLRDISSVGDTFNCSVTASAPIIKMSHRLCMTIMIIDSLYSCMTSIYRASPHCEFLHRLSSIDQLDE